MENTQTLDLITLGRVSMDLFSEQLGAPFTDIESFSTSVGGSPTNIAIGTSQLGLRSAAFTAVGDDKVGDFVRNYIQKKGVNIDYILTKAGKRTGLAVLGIEPPDKFPLVFYRDDPADIYLDIDDVLALPMADTRALLLSGTALSRGSCRDATLFAAEQAQAHNLTVFHDLDLRPDQWTHIQSFGVWQRTLLPQLNVIIGTEEEFFACLSESSSDSVDHIMQGGSVNDEQRVMLETALPQLFNDYPLLQVIVLKRGAAGVTLLRRDATPVNVAGFTVTIVNTVGAGDAFASGLIYGWSQGWAWPQSTQFANACGALVVTRHGCAAAMPTLPEVEEFLEEKG
ncbi:MAG: 5-dehydro-2-deoxygluconokinase [Chloroflexota bacterium]